MYLWRLYLSHKALKEQAESRELDARSQIVHQGLSAHYVDTPLHSLYSSHLRYLEQDWGLGDRCHLDVI